MVDNKRQKVRQEVTGDVEYMTLQNVLDDANRIIELNPGLTYSNFTFYEDSSNCYYESDTPYMKLFYKRDETDVEMKRRIDEAEHREKQREIQDRQNYERLKAKFEK